MSRRNSANRRPAPLPDGASRSARWERHPRGRLHPARRSPWWSCRLRAPRLRPLQEVRFLRSPPGSGPGIARASPERPGFPRPFCTIPATRAPPRMWSGSPPPGRPEASPTSLPPMWRAVPRSVTPPAFIGKDDFVNMAPCAYCGVLLQPARANKVPPARACGREFCPADRC